MFKVKITTVMCVAIGSIISFSGYASPRNLDCKLKRVKAYRQTYVLNNSGPKKESQVYFIQNKSDKPLMLNHPTERNGAQAGWSSMLDPNKWSALVVSQNGFKLSCMANKGQQFRPTDCKGVIAICQPPTRLRMQAKGSYWLIENQNWLQFKESLEMEEIS